MMKELVPYGTTVGDVLRHRGKAEDWELLSNIAAILMDKEDKKGLETLTGTERYVCAIHGMTMQVNNGGFYQFFYNSSGQFAYDLVSALEAVGSTEFKSLAQKALDIFGEIASLDESSMQEHLDILTEDDELQPWDDIDDQYYECGEQIESLTIEYVGDHLDDIDA